LEPVSSTFIDVSLILTVADFLKLVAYLGFFSILTIFYGIPIYIIRDLYLTMRSFTKRINDYLKYQSATRNMNSRYPDATADELAADNTCIVCREEMRPWIGTNPQADPAARENAQIYSLSERQRPKKLPCNHILHFSCLRSWLERQQACPICRRSVLRPPTVPGDSRQGAVQAGNGENQGPAQQGAGHPHNQGLERQHNGINFRLGPIHVFFGRVGGEREVLNRLVQNLNNAQQGNQAAQAAQPAQPGAAPAANNQAAQTGAMAQPTNTAHHHHTAQVPLQLQQARPQVRSAAIHTQLNAIESMIHQEIQQLNVAQYRVGLVRSLQAELDRARLAQHQLQTINLNNIQAIRSGTVANLSLTNQANLTTGNGSDTAVPITLPEGWRLLPLNPLGAHPTPTMPRPSNSQPPSTATPAPTESAQPRMNGGIPVPAVTASAAVPIAQPTPSRRSSQVANFGTPAPNASSLAAADTDDAADWITDSEGSPEQSKTVVEQIAGPSASASSSSSSSSSSATVTHPLAAADQPTWSFDAPPAASSQLDPSRRSTVEDADEE
jgi:E3 ubiquitin-protein ligase synoviolin